MRYSESLDYLIPSIIYLGTQEFWWARSPQAMADELALDHKQLHAVFNGFPAIYRKSRRLSQTGESFYCLQARYAQRKGGETGDPEQLSWIAPLDAGKLKLVIEFVTHMAEAERASSRSWITGGIAITAAIFSATAAIATALMKHP